MIRRLIAGLLLLGAAAATSASAQTVNLHGRLIGPDGAPVPDERVVLHRVVGAAGANIAETRSDAAGLFVVPVDSADNPDAVYFLAARWDDELYIGEAFRAPFDTADHVLQVGVPGTSASALIEGTTPQPPRTGTTPPAATSGSPATRTSWLLLAVPLIALLGVALYFGLRARTAVPPRRVLLRRIAELDLAHATDPTDAYRAERGVLIARLREATD